MLFLSCFLLCFRARLFIDTLWSPAGKGLIPWLSFVMSNCEVVTFPVVSWVRCAAWLYRFLIFALFLTSKFYHGYSPLIVKYNIGLETLLQQGTLEQVFYGDVVVKFKGIIGKPNFSDQFQKITKLYTKLNITWISYEVCMSGCKLNHSLKLWFPLNLHDGESCLKLNGAGLGRLLPDVCLWLDQPGLNLRLSLALLANFLFHHSVFRLDCFSVMMHCKS